MRVLKHFVKVAKAYVARINCKHKSSHTASCPFTGYTYVTCDKCMKYIHVSVTETE